jgi:Tfp pilus assembly protein PilE
MIKKSRTEVTTLSFRIITLASIAIVLFLLIATSQVLAQTDVTEARAILDNVSSFLERAYVAVAKADNAQANVTELKAKLNEGGLLLTAANASFTAGNYSVAVDSAIRANESIKGVEEEALKLAISARDDKTQRFYWAIVESSIGLSLAVFVVLVSWVYFRRYYVRRVLGLKPEVRKSGAS